MISVTPADSQGRHYSMCAKLMHYNNGSHVDNIAPQRGDFSRRRIEACTEVTIPGDRRNW